MGRWTPSLVSSILVLAICLFGVSNSMTKEEKSALKNEALEMFHHAFKNYMDRAYPADELMPLSCKGRYRGSEPSRGDIDDVLGNFSVSLIDSLDTLVILGELDLFEESVRNLIRDVRFDSDIVVSVFETNIRVIGGLLGGHLMAEHLKKKLNRMKWYKGELLDFARDVGDRLLPAFNTSTGMPYPRVNLKYGINHEMSRAGQEKDTCTACAGTMLLEFSALSRLTGRSIYEEKATKAMDYLWQSRHRATDLVGTVINIQNGDWVRKESGVGAGIDSYYEYLLKAYIMLGDDVYLDRFNTHYKAIMKYVNNGPLMLDVHMHRPQTNARNFMDSLLAFWPGLQVLKGDLKPAIEIHEMLYQVMLRHNFLPEAFTSDFRVHWAQHPLRPEFLESTYFIYKATGDPHYLEVGKKVMENLNKIARVECGFAAIKDVMTGDHEDQMDSFVFAETFKYLYLLFSEKEDLVVDVDDYIFTTEAHLLPLFLSMQGQSNKTEDIPSHILQSLKEEEEEERNGDDEDENSEFSNTCPSAAHLFKGTINYAQDLRDPLKNMVERLCPQPVQRRGSRLKAIDFIAGNREQMEHLNQMGIRLITMNDGRVQLVHVSSEAISPEASHDGMLFMQEMIELSKSQTKEVPLEPRVIQLLSSPIFGSIVLKAGPAQFGLNLKNHQGIEGRIIVANPYDGCSPLENKMEVQSKIVVVERGGCMFVEKARNIQEAGGIASVVCDNNMASSGTQTQYFSMSGDGKTDVKIPAVFLFMEEAKILHNAIATNPELVVYVGERARKSEEVMKKYVDVKSTVEQFANALEKMVDSTNNPSEDDVRPNFNEKTHKTLEFILNRLGLERLVPIVKPRLSNVADDDFIETSQVKVIRQMADTSCETIDEHAKKCSQENTKGDTGTLPAVAPAESDGAGMNSGTGGVDGLKNGEEQQRNARLIYGEVMLLLQKCTNIGKLQLAMEFDFKKTSDALARLTEHAYTSGAMGFGVETETMLERIKNRLTINSDDEECILPPSHEQQKHSSADYETDKNKPSDEEEDKKVIFTVAKSLNVDSGKLNEVLDQFVENQVADLFKQLWVATTNDDKNAAGEAGQSSDEQKCSDSSIDGKTKKEESLTVNIHKKAVRLGEHKNVADLVKRMVEDNQSEKNNFKSFSTITCNQDGCFEISIDEKESIKESLPQGNSENERDDVIVKSVYLTTNNADELPSTRQEINSPVVSDWTRTNDQGASTTSTDNEDGASTTTTNAADEEKASSTLTGIDQERSSNNNINNEGDFTTLTHHVPLKSPDQPSSSSPSSSASTSDDTRTHNLPVDDDGGGGGDNDAT